jgi:pyruvate,water dikinase
MRITRTGTPADIGGKASALASLSEAGLPIPAWFAVSADNAPMGSQSLDDQDLQSAIASIAPHGELLAVRSSAVEEDSSDHSFAGQYETFLFVRPADVPRRIRDLWNTAASDRVNAYRHERGLTGETPQPAALIQRMVDPEVSGVAFSADPVSGRRSLCVIAATYGVGTALVSGDVDADTFHVERDGTISFRQIARKTSAHRRGADGIIEQPVDEALADAATLNDSQVLQVAALARAAERHFGRPQDIEWAFAGDTLFLLQSRPITTLAALPDPDGEPILWDNSNIVESYSGVTTPLTFSFARYVYENVYREFCRMLRVPDSRLDASDGALRNMLGLIQGRVYYNLVSWYRVLALLPGYQVNRAFMEQMMGVKEALPAEIAARIVAPAPDFRARLADAFALAHSALALIGTHRRMNASVKTFQARLNASLALGGDLTTYRPDELVAHYRDLERALLRRWDAPLANDFLAMIFYGVLRKLCASWCNDTHETLQNDLVSGDGAVLSAEPARRIVEMALLVRDDPALTTVLCDGSMSVIRRAMAQHPAVQSAFTDYLARFGDRCLEELKLETMTLDDDPLLLARSVGQVARSRATIDTPPVERSDIRGDAERRAFAAIGWRPLRRVVFGWVLRHARDRIRDRENLRFERTRVFGRVRRIVVEVGKRYAAVNALDDPRDVFYLTIDEALGWPSAETASSDLRALADARKAEFARFAAIPAPPDRFVTRGAVHGHDVNTLSAAIGESLTRDTTPYSQADTERRGTGCYPGVVRGHVRVVRDPRSAVMEPGEILVAERTDPGWIMLFPASSGLLVERGSLLSHSAIVARELALPAVVSVPGLTSWLRTGDLVEFDGRTGVIRRLESVEPTA